MTVDDFQFALDLLKNAKIDEANDYLDDLDHPIAREWLARLKAASLTSTSALKQQQRRQAAQQRMSTSPAAPPAPTPAPAKPKPAPRKKSKKPAVIRTDTVTIFEAWGRNLGAMNHTEYFWVPVIGGIVVWIVALLIFQVLWLVFSVILVAVALGYIFTTTEVTRVNADNGRVSRQYQARSWVHYQVKTSPARNLSFAGDPLNLSYPISIAAFSTISRVRDEKMAATMLIRAVIIGLWEQGVINVQVVSLERHVFDNPVARDMNIYYFVPGKANLKQVTGALERHLISKLAYWQRNNPSHIQSRPWQQGPTPYELTLEIMGRAHHTAARNIIMMVARDAAEKKLARPGGRSHQGKGFQFVPQAAEQIHAEGQRLLTAMANSGRANAGFTSMLHNQISTAVRKRTPSQTSS